MPNRRSPEPKFELLQADDYDQYLLREGREIAFVLKQLAARRAMITAYFGNGSKFLLSSVVGLASDERSLFLDLGNDELAIGEALVGGQLICVTQLDKVKIQFQIERLVRTEYEGFPALQTPLPEVLLRLQRREFYRLAAPSADPLICRLTVEDVVQRKFEAKVVDISGGGLAVLVPPKGAEFHAEMTFTDCRLDLPDFGPVSASLRVRNLFKITQRNGTELLRAGCQFYDLPTSMANTIQRYILKVERERKSLGLYT